MTDNFKNDVLEVEVKWQQAWFNTGVFKYNSHEVSKPKYYVLEMLPYPSGRLHMGHVRNYTAGDVQARYRRMLGYNVLYTIGWDTFGLPAENAAIAGSKSPDQWTLANIEDMKAHLKRLGLSYEWSRETATCLPEYYKHEQAIFIKMMKAGIAYRKEGIVNWDPVDKTVLANEQVIAGRGWRSGAVVEKKKLYQWFLKIGDYAEDLLNGLDELPNWPDKIKTMQRNWIGKSNGAEVDFELDNGETVTIFTTRVDTLFGASFVAVAPTHKLAEELGKTNPQLRQFCLTHAYRKEQDNTEKCGFNTGLQVVNPINRAKVPVYIANFVSSEYATGAIFGCPAHDERDYEFAVKYSLPIKQVIKANTLPYGGEGQMINSEFLNGLHNTDAKGKVVQYLVGIGKCRSVTTYKLKDWGISRQRYWGCPIPVVHCKKCGVVPEKEENLPITLPTDCVIDGKSNPLETHPKWKYCKCPVCGIDAVRETDTFDTFWESSWYFLRYADPHNTKEPFNTDIINKLLPVDDYIGGVEHAILHLLYARFFTRVLKGFGMVNFSEPFTRLTTQGMVCAHAYKVSGTMVERYVVDKLNELSTRSTNFYEDQEAKDAESIEQTSYELETRSVRYHINGEENSTHFNHEISRYVPRDICKFCDKNEDPYKEVLEWLAKNLREGDAIYEEKDKIRKILKGRIIVEDSSLHSRSKHLFVEDIGVCKMSKSKLNGVGPDEIIDRFGADAVRLFILSDTPFDMEIVWSDDKIMAAFNSLKRIKKLIEMVASNSVGSITKIEDNASAKAIIKVVYSTIKNVSSCIEVFEFNKAIAYLYTLISVIKSNVGNVDCINVNWFAVKVLVQLLSPITPHFAEEAWQKLGFDGLVCTSSYPLLSLLEEDMFFSDDNFISFGVQVNGKLRGEITVPSSSTPEHCIEKALGVSSVARAVGVQSVNYAKTIAIVGKIVNIVTTPSDAS